MIPSKVCDGQGELEVLGLDVDVDVAHHVDQELDSLLRQRHELARRLLLQQRVECYKQADGQDFPNLTSCEGSLCYHLTSRQSLMGINQTYSSW